MSNVTRLDLHASEVIFTHHVPLRAMPRPVRWVVAFGVVRALVPAAWAVAHGSGMPVLGTSAALALTAYRVACGREDWRRYERVWSTASAVGASIVSTALILQAASLDTILPWALFAIGQAAWAIWMGHPTIRAWTHARSTPLES